MGADHAIACPRCGGMNPQGFRFCGRCGGSMERTCASCGAAAPAGFRFCGRCGAAVDAPGPAPHGVEERKLVTMLFADLTASTELAARLDPEDLQAVLRPFFAAMEKEVTRYGGGVEKFIGDAIVAVFGVPTAHEDDPERAVRAALAMQARLSEVNEGLRADHGIELSMRIGVNTGEVVAVASGDREGSVTGEAMNVAARLQAAAEPGAVLVGERTQRATAYAIEYRPAGTVAAKGIPEPLRVWTAVNPVVRHDRPVAMRAPLVGRRAELELLRVLLERARTEKRPALVTIVGPAGIGKSRLTQEFVAALEPRVRTARGRCLPYGDGLTYWPLAEILKADAGILDSDPPDVALRKARAELGDRFGDEAASTVAVLLSSIGIDTQSTPLSDVASAVARELIERSWRAFFESLARDSAVVAVIEDLHWADPSLLALLERLAARLRGAILLLCTARPELTDRRSGWGGGLQNASTVSLSPLTDEESRALAGHLLGEGGAAAETLTPVLRRAEGNPFFAEELLRMLVEEGILRREREGWMLSRELPATLPDTVQGVVAARIDLLRPEEKETIQAAAVVGRTFWKGAVDLLLGRDAAAELDALVDKGLFRDREGSAFAGDRELTFSHVLIRDVAYASIPRARRPGAHAEAGRWVEHVAGERAEEFAEILAHHFERADDLQRTVRYSMFAGHRKRRVFAAEEAIGWYDRALEATGRLGAGHERLVAEISLARGEASEQLTRYPDAQSDDQRAAEAARAAGDARLEAEALAALANALWLEDKIEETDAALGDAMARARAADAHDVLARLLYTAGGVAFGRGQWERAIAFHEEALDVARRAGDPMGEALALHGICEGRWGLGGYLAGLDAGRRASELLRALGHRPMLYHNEYMVAWALWLTGSLDEATRVVDAAVQGAHELGDLRNELAARATRTMVRLSAGDLGDALRDADRSLRLARELALPRMQITSISTRIFVLAELRGFDRSDPEVEAAMAHYDRLGGTYMKAGLLAHRAWRLLRAGARDEADGVFAEARDAGAGLTERMEAARIELLAREQQGDTAGAAEAGRRLVEEAREESPPFLAWGLYGRALGDADPQEAVERVLRALETASEVGERPVVWRAAKLLAERFDAAGRFDEAAVARSRAAEAVSTMAATLEGDERAAFLARPDVASAVMVP